MRSLTKKIKTLFKAVHLLHCVSVGPFAYDHYNHHKWVTLGLYAIEGHFRHKSQICVRVWAFFVSYPNGKGIQGKRFRFRFQRSENCYPFFFFFKRCVPTAPGTRKRRIRSYTKYIVPWLGPSWVVCTTTFGCCAWWPFELARMEPSRLEHTL